MQIWLSPDGFSAVAAELNASEIFRRFSLDFIDDFKMLIKESGLLDWTRRLWPRYLGVVFFSSQPIFCTYGVTGRALEPTPAACGRGRVRHPWTRGFAALPKGSSTLKLVPAPLLLPAHTSIFCPQPEHPAPSRRSCRHYYCCCYILRSEDFNS